MLKRRDWQRPGRPGVGKPGGRRLAPRLEGLEGRRLLAAAINEVPIPTPMAGAFFITPGPDGNVWFTENSANKVGRLTPSTGAIVEASIPTASSSPEGITAGPDGNLWFTENSANKVGRLIPRTGAVTEFPIPTPNSAPTGIAAGPDGNLYFTENGANRIGRISPATGAIASFPIPTANSGPIGIAAGPDGNLYFAENSVGKIGRFSPGSRTFAEIATAAAGGGPFAIAPGPDGNLYFTEESVNRIGRLNPNTGAIAEGTVPTAASTPTGITAGPDGNIWFTEQTGNKIGTLNLTTGAITESPVPTAAAGPLGITAGPNGNLYFTESMGNKIGEVVIPRTGTLTGLTIAPNPGFAGQPVTITVVVGGPAGGPVPAGNVIVTVDGRALPPARLTTFRGQGFATVTTGPLAAGSHAILATFPGGTTFAPSASSQTLTVVSPPTVLSVRRGGFHGRPTSLVLTFSAPLDVMTAQNASNYALRAHDGQPIFIETATYDPATRTVTLRPNLPLNVHRPYTLTVTGARPFGIRDTAGRFLAGAGQPGTAFVATINGRTPFVAVHPAARRHAIGGVPGVN